MEYITFSLSCQNVDIYLNIDVLCSVCGQKFTVHRVAQASLEGSANHPFKMGPIPEILIPHA